MSDSGSDSLFIKEKRYTGSKAAITVEWLEDGLGTKAQYLASLSSEDIEIRPHNDFNDHSSLQGCLGVKIRLGFFIRDWKHMILWAYFLPPESNNLEGAVLFHIYTTERTHHLHIPSTRLETLKNIRWSKPFKIEDGIDVLCAELIYRFLKHDVKLPRHIDFEKGFEDNLLRASSRLVI